MLFLVVGEFSLSCGSAYSLEADRTEGKLESPNIAAVIERRQMATVSLAHLIQSYLCDTAQIVKSKRVVLAVCTGWLGSEMMSSCRKQRVRVGCR